jgi:sugar phosphate isomerase/epimerase
MKTQLSRREFLNRAAWCGLAASVSPALLSRGASSGPMRQFKLCLVPGSIGIKVAPQDILALAHQHGFEAIEANAAFLASLSETALAAFQAEMKAKGLVFGAASLPVDFRQDDAKFRAGLEELPKLAAGLQRAGVTRVGTWVAPAHDDLTYEQNFQQHASRLREVARVLKDHDLRLGLEYVGTPSSRQGRRNPFIHSMAGMRKLIGEIGTGNVGYVLDTWHWWTAGETEADLRSLKVTDIVSVDLNDAPAGIPMEQQQDNQRELACATGVIPVAGFLTALQRLGYDGPVRAEPFNKKLKAMSTDEACAAVIASLRQAVALLK